MFLLWLWSDSIESYSIGTINLHFLRKLSIIEDHRLLIYLKVCSFISLIAKWQNKLWAFVLGINCILTKLHFSENLCGIVTMAPSIPLNLSITDCNFWCKNPDERRYHWCIAVHILDNYPRMKIVPILSDIHRPSWKHAGCDGQNTVLSQI